MRLKNEATRCSDSSPSAFQETFGSLDGCMLSGDPEQSNRERRIRRWSLGTSVALQAVLITAMVIAPLLAKTEQITYRVTPLPPYAGQPKASQRRVPRHSQPPRAFLTASFLYGIKPITVTHTSRRDDTSTDEPLFGAGSSGPGDVGLIPIGDSRSRPTPPTTEPQKNRVKRLRVTSIVPAMLTRRVEPVYPVLAHQTHRTGRVELHAIISTDGSIQSLEVIAGDPLFVQSALDAVREWRYRPTMLNGEPVEVDTSITVVYSLGDQRR